MANGKTVLHYGAPGLKRNEDLFQRALAGFDPLSPATLYVVAGRVRRDQLRTRFLEVFPEAFEIPVVTLSELVRRLARAQSPPTRRIDTTGKQALLEEIMEDGFHVGHPDFRAGSLPYVSQFIAFIKSQNISDPEMLELRYRKSQRQPSPLECDLIRIFGRYQAVINAHHLEDDEDEQTRVYTGLLTGALDPAACFGGLRRLVMESFYRLTPLQAGIVHHLLQSVEEAEISIGGLETPQLDPDRPEWEFLDTPGVEWVHHPPEPRVDPGFVRPESRPGEVATVAGRIERLRRRDPGLRFNEMAIVCAAPDRYRALLENTFGDLGLPLSFVGGAPVSESATAASLLKYLRMVDEDFSSASLFDFFLEPCVQVEGLTAETIRMLERMAKKSGVSSGFAAWRGEFGPFVKLYADQLRQKSPSTALRLEAGVGSFLQALDALRPDIQVERTLSQWRRETASRLQPFWRPVSGRDQRPASWNDNRLFREFWTQLASACVASPNQRPYPFRRFKRLAESQLAGSRARLEPLEEAIVVATPKDLQQARFRHLFWIGLAEGEFPDNPNQHIFFDDVRSSQWGFANWEDRLLENQWLFESVAASAEDGLFLSCPLKIRETAVSPSVFWNAPRPAGKSQPEARPEGWALDFSLTPAARDNARRGIAVQWLRESGPYSTFQGFFADPKMVVGLREALFEESLEISPSQLENYVRCGFRYFLEKVAGIQALEEESGEVTPLERGNLIHSVLFRFIKGLETPVDFDEETRVGWTRGQRRRIHDILQRELARLRLEKRWRDELFWTHEEKLLSDGLLSEGGRGILAEFVDQQWDRLRNHHFEAAELRVGPVDLGLLADLERARLVPVRLRGKIDRLDSGREGLVVVDYKTGQDQLPRVYQGWGFQLPLYRFMVRSVQDRPVAGAAFYSIRIPDEVRLREVVACHPDGDPTSGLDALEQYYRNKAIEAARLLFDGRFPVTLLGPSNAGCRVCAYRGVCRYSAAEMEPVRGSGLFPIDEPIIQRGRWIQPDQNSKEELTTA